MKRTDILFRASALISGQRHDSYGSAKDNFQTVANLWNAYLAGRNKDRGSDITAKDVGMLLALLKISRIASGKPKDDNYVDAAGYIALAGEISEKNLDDKVIEDPTTIGPTLGAPYINNYVPQFIEAYPGKILWSSWSPAPTNLNGYDVATGHKVADES